MKLSVSLIIIVAEVSILTACAPHYSYKDQVMAQNLPAGKTAKTRVSASVEDWRDSGVIAEAGKNYRISAQGQWRTYPTCNFTGPDGIGLYKAWCDKSPLFPTIVEGYSHSTLIAKIGRTGTPFAVGASFELTAQNSGPLLFRTNDTANGNHDNEGYVDVEILADAGKPEVSPPRYAEIDQTPPKPAPSPAPSFSAASKKIPVDVLASTLQKRTALVIGNSDYAYSPLKNPVNDAKAMAGALKTLGFDVTLALNADQEQMETAIDRFGRKLMSGGHVGLFYYAGHGVQVDGSNYLIPVGVQINRQSDVRYKAVDVGQVLGAMGEATDNLNIVILDACRDNPLPRSFRGGSRGLARVEGPKGTIIGFATSPGSTAADGDGANGLYTKHLLSNMREPGISIEQVFKQVLQGVNEETGGQQIPWTESSFTGNFSFAP